MKKSTIWKSLATLGFAVLGWTSLNAQAPITVDSRSLYEHGYNSGGSSTFEATDSVTNGGTTYYYVMPDANVNSGFNAATDLFANVTSTFTWSITGTPTGTIAAVAAHPTAEQYKQISWTGLGLGAIEVIERSTNNCDGSTRSIPVMVINAPSVTAVAFSAVDCPTGVPPYSVNGPTATLTLSSDLAAGHRDVEVYYSITGPAGFTSVGSTLASIDEGNTIDLSGVTLTQPGTYTFRVISITDRISRKSGVVNTLNADYTFVLNRAPVTGPIYHLPNL